MKNIIKFHAPRNVVDAFPHPFPAGKVLPDWFKDLPPALSSHPRSSSVKRCIPFLEALSQGYIIPFHCDVFVRANNGELDFEFAEKEVSKGMDDHSYDQVFGHPLKDTQYGSLPLKWLNLWTIETPKEYSCLFTAPLNRPDKRFKIIDGIVDTDSYYNPIHFPFVWTGGDGEFLITKGTPLIQVIPFKRISTKHEIGILDQRKKDKTQNKLVTLFNSGYRRLHWHKLRGDKNESS